MKKTTIRIVWPIFLLGLLIYSCQPIVNSPTATTLPPISTSQPTKISNTAEVPSPHSTATLIQQPTPPPEKVLTQYRLDARFNYNLHYLAVEERIVFTNTYEMPLDDLALAAEPARYPASFKVNTIKVENTLFTSYKLEGNQLKILLTESLQPGKSLQIDISYELFLPVIPAPSNEIRAAIYGYSARQTNLVDWYLYIPPYSRDAGWIIHNPWYYGEHQVYEKADFEVNLTLIDPPANLSIAAASQPTVSGNRYTFQHKNARNFTLSASNMYVVYATIVGTITVTSYAFTFDAIGGRTALNDAAQAITLYSQLFGPYPHKSLSVVEADFHDGMEYDGLYFLSKGFYSTYDGTPKGYLTMIGVHESAHQWWYALVANDQALEPWLDEALSTYSELLFYNNYYPDLMKWWWSYRVDFFQPSGWVNLRIYDYGGAYPYRDGVYLRGAQFIDQVRQRIGDEAFFRMIKSYSSQYRDQISKAQNFFSLISHHSTVVISDLKAKFFKP